MLLLVSLGSAAYRTLIAGLYLLACTATTACKSGSVAVFALLGNSLAASAVTGTVTATVLFFTLLTGLSLTNVNRSGA